MSQGPLAHGSGYARAARGVFLGVLKRFSSERWLIVATAVAAALPVIVSTVRGLTAGWVPLSDQAAAATRAYDVFTSETPLVGPWSSSSTSLGEPTYHPGPLLYWLLAVPARLPVAAFPVTMGVVNTAAVAGAVALAHRRGGRQLMFVTAAAIAPHVQLARNGSPP